MVYNILDYGAVGDGRTNDGPAIQKALTPARRRAAGACWCRVGTPTNQALCCYTAMWSCTLPMARG